jgi:hypothetical protein
MSGSLYESAQAFIYPGAGMGAAGVSMQLGALGTMGALTFSSPSLSFWRFQYCHVTNAAMLSVCQTFDSQVAFGATSTAKIVKSGDLLYFLYAVIQLPGIRACPPRAGGCGPTQQFPYATDANNPCAQTDAEYFASVQGGVSDWLFQQYGACGDYVDDCAANACGGGGCDTEPWAHWVNAIGQFVLRKVNLMIGSQVVDTLYNDYLFMWEELAGKPGKRLTEMIGKYYCRDDLIAFAQQTRILYVPLPFYFTQTPGNSLALVALSFAWAQIMITWENLQNCVVVSGPDIQVVKCNGFGPLAPGDLAAFLDGTQVYLDVIERDRFAAVWFEQLITQTQSLYQCVQCSNVRINLGFAFSVVELIWAVRRRCQEKANNWFNYSGILGKEPLISAGLLFNNQDRVPARNASYFRLVQPYQYHSLIPDAYVYNYSFALYPEEAQPSGAANFSRLESVTLVLELQEGLDQEDITVIIFARSLNMLKYRDGVSGLAFSS